MRHYNSKRFLKKNKHEYNCVKIVRIKTFLCVLPLYGLINVENGVKAQNQIPTEGN